MKAASIRAIETHKQQPEGRRQLLRIAKWFRIRAPLGWPESFCILDVQGELVQRLIPNTGNAKSSSYFSYSWLQVRASAYLAARRHRSGQPVLQFHSAK
jgi:hypothetical protein